MGTQRQTYLEALSVMADGTKQITVRSLASGGNGYQPATHVAVRERNPIV